MKSRPATTREERRFSRKVGRRYAHMVGFDCNRSRRWRAPCWRCLWWTASGKRARERREFIARANAVRDCAHENREPNPRATAVLDRNPEVCLDCGVGLIGPRKAA